MTNYLSQKTIDAAAIQGDWFGQVDAEVFISHSHSDLDLALSVAGWLSSQFGLSSFVDSSVWGHANTLLKILDKKYCWMDDKGSYDYDSRNRSTSHVHMMLSTALSKMIDRTECIIFLNTPESIVVEDAITEVGDEKTGSPWIYAELVASRLIRKKEPVRHPVTESYDDGLMKRQATAGTIPIRYAVGEELNLLTPLSIRDLEVWEAHSSNAQVASKLDVLYQIKPLKNQTK
ncbi:hypothetical protein [Paraburkholderia sp. C35]|uniref:hypothetical protein n=1 Tax=Paraburkholderia sp. C35 TaxID=2126993 RepID=UPI0019505615|nr:hypothetical protein [Paraburkholderia sp. C35]